VGGEFLLVPPGWSGKAPNGSRSVPAPAGVFASGGRFLVNGEADIPTATLQDGLGGSTRSR
jgi:hypothetical protein